uniref:CCD97-like C-terminal domain-containing protein n=1 Tax=Pectinophora gossypiella TaxID=13191 RepID=A0A1E1W6Z7_PECGO
MEIASDVDNATERENEEDIDPINDIIDYLVRCAKISFKNAHVHETEVRTGDKIRMACDLYQRSPTEFLMQFGKYLAPYHVGYFENLQPKEGELERYKECIIQLKNYHSEDSRRKRTRNRRFKAMQKLQEDTDYFSEKQMMFRNPLLYEQLVGQYLTDKEIAERDGVDRENLTFLNMILETVDRNQMRETKNEQMLEEEDDSPTSSEKGENSKGDDTPPKNRKQWGDFDTPDTTPSFKPEIRKQTMISAPERRLLREEFLQEMFSSFIEGRDEDVDYNSIDNDEQFDDLQQVSQDAEDRYFDSETNEVDNLEEHMKLVQEYGRKNSNDIGNATDDPLDVFMKHINIKQNCN